VGLAFWIVGPCRHSKRGALTCRSCCCPLVLPGGQPCPGPCCLALGGEGGELRTQRPRRDVWQGLGIRWGLDLRNVQQALEVNPGLVSADPFALRPPVRCSFLLLTQERIRMPRADPGVRGRKLAYGQLAAAGSLMVYSLKWAANLPTLIGPVVDDIVQLAQPGPFGRFNIKLETIF